MPEKIEAFFIINYPLSIFPFLFPAFYLSSASLRLPVGGQVDLSADRQALVWQQFYSTLVLLSVTHYR
jgi:hypothetical protein